jgi:peptidoglycan/LPS O-acetylase OafA/YrhL
MEPSSQDNLSVKRNDGKIPIVETLRGIATLSVLFHHWTICVPGFIQNAFMLAFCNRLNIGVYIFFGISGFIMPYALHRGGYRLRHIGQFVLKRIIRLDPPYIASIAFCVIIAYVATLHPLYTGVPFRLNPLNLLLHLGYLCPFFGQPWVQGGVYWTLGIEFQFYLILALAYPLLINQKQWISLITVILFTALCAFDGNRYRFNFITSYAPFFSMGMVTFLFRIGRLHIRTYLLLLLLLSSLAGIKFEWHQMAGGLAASLLIAFYQGARAPLVFFGTISYSIYLFHAPIAIKTVNYLMRYSWAVKFNWAIVLLGACFCVLVAWLAYLVLEKPSKAFSQKIKYGRKAGPAIDLVAQKLGESMAKPT